MCIWRTTFADVTNIDVFRVEMCADELRDESSAVVDRVVLLVAGLVDFGDFVIE